MDCYPTSNVLPDYQIHSIRKKKKNPVKADPFEELCKIYYFWESCTKIHIHYIYFYSSIFPVVLFCDILITVLANILNRR